MLKTKNDVIEMLEEEIADEEIVNKIVMFDNLGPAIIGITHDSRLVYEYDRILAHLMRRDGMTHTEAIEWYDKNIEPEIPYMENRGIAPIIVRTLEPDEAIYEGLPEHLFND